LPKDDATGVSTVQLKKETKEFLRILIAHTKVRCYDDVVAMYLRPLVEKSAGTKDPVKISKWLMEQFPKKL